jgi:hypothetical protein
MGQSGWVHSALGRAVLLSVLTTLPAFGFEMSPMRLISIYFPKKTKGRVKKGGNNEGNRVVLTFSHPYAHGYLLCNYISIKVN